MLTMRIDIRQKILKDLAKNVQTDMDLSMQGLKDLLQRTWVSHVEKKTNTSKPDYMKAMSVKVVEEGDAFELQLNGWLGEKVEKGGSGWSLRYQFLKDGSKSKVIPIGKPGVHGFRTVTQYKASHDSKGRFMKEKVRWPKNDCFPRSAITLGATKNWYHPGFTAKHIIDDVKNELEISMAGLFRFRKTWTGSAGGPGEDPQL